MTFCRHSPPAKDVSVAPQMEMALQMRDEAMDRVEAKAGEKFANAAGEFVVSYLRRNGDSAGEDITDACKSSGIIPHDDRAFGPVYMRLSRAGVIEHKGMVSRRKGHGTAGGRIWGLASVKPTISQ